MKAVGTGTALSAFGGAAAAQENGEGDGNGEDSDGGGNGGADEGGQPDDGATVHRVETLIRGPPTNPDRPADFFYQPTGLAVQPGDVVKVVFATPDHNFVSYHPAFGMRRRMPTGVGPFSSPIRGWRPDSIADDQIEPPSGMGGGGEGEDGNGENGNDDENGGSAEQPVPDTWLVSFDTPGVYDVLCSPHEHFGMAMRVVVGDETDAPFETSNPENLPPPRAGPVGQARTTLTDSALEPSNIVSAGSVAWEDLEANQGGGSGSGE